MILKLGSRVDLQNRQGKGGFPLAAWVSADPARVEEIIVQTHFLPGGKQKLNSGFPPPIFQESALAAEPYRGLTKRPFQRLLVKIFHLCM